MAYIPSFGRGILFVKHYYFSFCAFKQKYVVWSIYEIISPFSAKKDYLENIRNFHDKGLLIHVYFKNMFSCHIYFPKSCMEMKSFPWYVNKQGKKARCCQLIQVHFDLLYQMRFHPGRKNVQRELGWMLFSFWPSLFTRKITTSFGPLKIGGRKITQNNVVLLLGLTSFYFQDLHQNFG